MYARIGRISFSRDKAEDVIGHVRENVIPMYKDNEGYHGFRLLVDRENGRGLGVSYWDTEEQLHATDEVSDKARSGAASAGGGSVESVEVYEIVVDERA